MPEVPLSYVYEPSKFLERGKAYGSCFGGRRFAVAHQTPGTEITGQTSYVATTPTFLLYQANTNGRRAVLSNFALGQVGTLAGGIIHVALVIEAANRYSTGGTAITPQAVMSDSDETAGFSFRYNATATSPSAARVLYEWVMPVQRGGILNPDLHDGVAIGQTGSILIYTWAATTGPTWTVCGFDILEDD